MAEENDKLNDIEVLARPVVYSLQSAVHLADESRHQQRSCLCNVLSVRGYQDNIFYLGFMRSHLLHCILITHYRHNAWTAIHPATLAQNRH